MQDLYYHIVFIVVKMFKEEKQESEEKINEMFENTSKGFLYKETIYRVKKND